MIIRIVNEQIQSISGITLTGSSIVNKTEGAFFGSIPVLTAEPCVVGSTKTMRLEPHREPPTVHFKQFRLRGGRADGLCAYLVDDVVGQFVDVDGERYWPAEVDEDGRQVFEFQENER